MANKRVKVEATLRILNELRSLIAQASDPESEMNVTDRYYIAIEGFRIVFHLVTYSQLEIKGLRRLGILGQVSLRRPEALLDLLSICVERLENNIWEKGIGA